MPTIHPCGCVCPCDPDKGRVAMTALTQYKKAVQEADEALKQIRNSGASEEEIQKLQTKRHEAQEKLVAAYMALVEQSDHPNAEVDEEEAVETDVSDDESDADISMDVGNSSMMSFGDDEEDDEDYVPPKEN